MFLLFSSIKNTLALSALNCVHQMAKCQFQIELHNRQMLTSLHLRIDIKDNEINLGIRDMLVKYTFNSK